MDFTSEPRLDDGVVERAFTLSDLSGVTGILWTPASASAATPVPLILMGHPGGLGPMRARLHARAIQSAGSGFASAAIELPGAGDRPSLEGPERARADLRAALRSGEQPSADIIDRLILPLVDQAVPEWRATVDEIESLPEVRGPFGFSGGPIAIAVHLVLADPRIAAAGLFAGSFVPERTMAEAHRISIPLHVLLQWDDEGNDRQMALDLFDAFGSKEKTLVANMGGHRGVPAHAGSAAGDFFERHLR